jgi:hypothetical protein
MTDPITSLVVADEDVAAAYMEVMGVAPDASELHYLRQVAARVLARARPIERPPGPTLGEPPAPERLHAEADEDGLRGLAVAFKVGLQQGIEPLALADVRATSCLGTLTLHLGPGTVDVRAEEMLRASNLETLGRATGLLLRRSRTRAHVRGPYERPREDEDDVS